MNADYPEFIRKDSAENPPRDGCEIIKYIYRNPSVRGSNAGLNRKIFYT